MHTKAWLSIRNARRETQHQPAGSSPPGFFLAAILGTFSGAKHVGFRLHVGSIVIILGTCSGSPTSQKSAPTDSLGGQHSLCEHYAESIKPQIHQTMPGKKMEFRLRFRTRCGQTHFYTPHAHCLILVPKKTVAR